MLMKPPTTPRTYVGAPTYHDLVNTLELIRHATAEKPDDTCWTATTASA
jgi:hypothetical protein